MENEVNEHQQQAKQSPDDPRQEVLGPDKNGGAQEAILAVDLVRAELDQAIVTAHRYPRKIEVFVKRLEAMALYDEAAADRCIYSLPRGNKPIVGPSIGFANILSSAWGNCRDGGRWIRTDRGEKVVMCEGAFFDLETNRQTNVSAVRRISDSRGRLYSDDMVIVTAQACTAIARRNAILNGVARPLWNPVYERALMIVRGTVQTLGERRDKMIAAFAAFGVEPRRIALALGVQGPDQITLDHIVVLRGMYEALKDGTMTAEEMFDPRRMTSGAFEKIDNPLGEEEDDDEESDGVVGDAEPGAPKASGVARGHSLEEAMRPHHAKTAAAAEPEPRPAAEPADLGEKKGDEDPPRKSVAQPAAEKEPPAAAKAASLAKAAAPEKPKTEEQYEAWAIDWIAREASATAIDDRWKGERKLRNDCGVVEDQRARLIAVKDARIRELQAGQE